METQLNYQRTIFEILEPIAQQRIDEQELSRSGIRVPEHVSIITSTLVVV